jgi:exodeoxyribonuclease VII large subunit
MKDPKDRRILSIGELTRYIKGKLEQDPLLSDVWVRGEISNFKHHSSGHMYFTLKDRTSQIRSVMFASANQRLAFRPQEGMLVIARGTVSVYERDGQYQFYVQQMQPDGIGSLYLAFEQLKKKLETEGLFDERRKRPIPRFPRTVGVVTSPTGAAVRDIITTLQRRYPQAGILLFPVLVQGEQAAPSIAAAIRRMNELGAADVLIVGRGGGSLEDLWPFNEELVARAIADSRIPVISAVGHETDFTIADFVADLRAATPTAAAELAVPHALELKQQTAQLRVRLTQAVLGKVRERRERLMRLSGHPYLRDPKRQLQAPAERLDRLREQLAYKMESRMRREAERTAELKYRISRFHPRQQMSLAAGKLEHLAGRLRHFAEANQRASAHRLAVAIRQLDALSPLKVMQRGYSLVYDEKERLIKSISQVQPGDMVHIRLADGKLDCQVWAMEEEEKASGGSNGQ